MVWFVLTTIEQYWPDSTVYTFQSDKYSKGLIDSEGSDYLMFLILLPFRWSQLPSILTDLFKLKFVALLRDALFTT